MNLTNIYEAKTNLSQLVAQAESGKEVIIARRGQPVARLVAVSDGPKSRPLGLYKNEIELKPDWNSDETNDEISNMFYGK